MNKKWVKGDQKRPAYSVCVHIWNSLCLHLRHSVIIRASMFAIIKVPVNHTQWKEYNK